MCNIEDQVLPNFLYYEKKDKLKNYVDFLDSQ